MRHRIKCKQCTRYITNYILKQNAAETVLQCFVYDKINFLTMTDNVTIIVIAFIRKKRIFRIWHECHTMFYDMTARKCYDASPW